MSHMGPWPRKLGLSGSVHHVLSPMKNERVAIMLVWYQNEAQIVRKFKNRNFKIMVFNLFKTSTGI